MKTVLFIVLSNFILFNTALADEALTEAEIKAVDMVEQISEGTVIVDIRSPEETENNPLEIDNVEVKHLPFYKLGTQFGDLDQSKEYLLY